MQALVRHDLNPPAQKILYVHEERPERQARAPRRQSDQQVDVTRIIRVSAGHRAEDADIAEAVSLCEGSYLRSMGLDQGVHRSCAQPLQQGYARDGATERSTSFSIRMSKARATSHSRR